MKIWRNVTRLMGPNVKFHDKTLNTWELNCGSLFGRNVTTISNCKLQIVAQLQKYTKLETAFWTKHESGSRCGRNIEK